MRKLITLFISLIWVMFTNAQVQQVEYFFDTDPGYGRAISAGTPVAGSGEFISDFSAPITSLSDGMHNLYVRAKSVKGWSQTMQRSFIKTTLPDEASQNLKHLEYFIDVDPGYGNGIPLDVITGIENYSFDINVSSLTDGLHTFYVRGQNQNGYWSQVMHYSFVKMRLPHERIPAIYMEYFVDIDPGLHSANPIDVNAADGIHNFTLPTNGLTEGPHILYVRAFFPNNTWSQVMQHAFVISNPSRKLKSLEYFVDTDPGYGLGMNVALSPDQEVFDFDVNTASLTDGLHTLYIRALNQSDLWSQTVNRSFVKTTLTGEVSQNLRHLEYFIDTDPGYGLGTAVAITPGNESYEMDINVNALTDGLHIFYARAQNQNGNWSQVMKYAFVKTGIAPSNLQYVEYYIDIDPGAGNGTEVTFSTSSDTLNFTANLDTISNGQHILYIRGKYDDNSWGNIGSHTFDVNNTISVTGISLNKHAISLDTTNTETLVATVIPGNADNRNVIWTSSDSNIATVANNGLVTAIAAGSAYIVATTQDGGFKDSCLVTVNGNIPATGISLNVRNITIQPGEFYYVGSLGLSVLPANATIRTIYVKTQDSSVTFNNSFLRGIKDGSSYVVFTTADGGFADSCLVTVQCPSNAISVGTHTKNALDYYPVKFVAPQTGVYRASSCNRTTSNTLMYVYKGCSVLNPIGYSDDFCGMQSNLAFYLNAGETVLIEWNHNGDTFDWDLVYESNPGNITCETATTAIVGSNTANHAISEDLYYTFIPAETSLYSISSCDPNASGARVVVYKGDDCNNRVEIGTQNIACSETFDFDGEQGEKYYFYFFKNTPVSYLWNLEKEEIIEIATPTQLDSVRYNPNKSYRLINDIDLTNWINNHTNNDIQTNGWRPISSFGGRLYGDGHIIKGLRINRPNADSVGLFGFVNGGLIEKLGIENCSITGGLDLGGLTGVSNAGNISNCFVSGTINGSGDIGGLCGLTSRNTNIINCHTSVSINGTGSYIGGLVGQNAGFSTIYNCYAQGSVTGSSYVGGLVGLLFAGNISHNVAANVSISATGNNPKGRIIGQQFSNGTCTNNYAWTGMTLNGDTIPSSDAVTDINGSGANTVDLNRQNLYQQTLGWNFTTIWNSCPQNNALPYLQWQNVICSNPIIPVTGINLSTHSLTINVGDSIPVTASVIPSNAANQNITTVSSNPSVGGITNAFKIYGSAPGTTLIIFTTADGGFKDTCAVTVNNPVIPATSISIKERGISIDINQDSTLTVIFNPTTATNKKVTWQSRNENIATVDTSGAVKGISYGETFVIATSEDGGFQDSCKIIVHDLGINLVKGEKNIHVYPNPTTGLLTIENGQQLKKESPIEMYTLSGVLVGRYAIDGKVKTIDISALPTGVYILKMNGQIMKVIKK